MLGSGRVEQSTGHPHRAHYKKAGRRWGCVSSWAGVRCSARWVRRRLAKGDVEVAQQFAELYG